jgi:hypothetical protein
MTDTELYQNLLEAAESVLRNDMLLNGVSDPAELAGHAWMLIKDGTWKLPEGEVSYVRLAKNAREILTAGSSPYGKDQKGQFVKHKYGRLLQAEGLEYFIPDSTPFEPDSDLDEVYPILKCVLEENNRECIEGVQEFGGNVKSYYEANPQLTITRQAFNNRVNKARKEFLAITPPDCDLYNTSRRLRRRYNIGEASVN